RHGANNQPTQSSSSRNPTSRRSYVSHHQPRATSPRPSAASHTSSRRQTAKSNRRLATPATRTWALSRWSGTKAESKCKTGVETSSQFVPIEIHHRDAESTEKRDYNRGWTQIDADSNMCLLS